MARVTHHVAPVGGVEHLFGAARVGDAVGESRPVRRGTLVEGGPERREGLLVRQVEASGIGAVGEEVARCGDAVMRGAGRSHRADGRHGVADQVVDRHFRIGDPVDEGGIGAVLEEPPHQIGQQRLVSTDGRVDAAGPVELRRADHLVVERLAHAVETLELILAAIEVRPRHGHHGPDRLGIVGGELREHRIGRRQEPPGAGEVADIRVDLAGEDRKPVEPVDLSALDLGVPIGAFHQPHHDAAAGAARQIDDPVDHEWGSACRRPG